MKAAAFEYVRPRHLAEAVRALSGTAGAKLLAGGQSLGPMLNLRLARPKLLVDIARLDVLRRIEDAGDAWRIGGAVTHAQLEDARGRLPGGEMVVEVAAGIAYRAVRNRGTIGGSLAHADPAADWPLALAALDATVLVHGAAGERRVPAERFMTAAFTTGLAEDEIVAAVLVPKRVVRTRFGYFKFCRKTGEFPEASAAVVLDDRRSETRVFVGALAGPPRRLPDLEHALGVGLAPTIIHDAIAAAIPELDPIERRMHLGVVKRALEQAMGV